MDHIKILKRAFHITKVYRALWLFGILLALTSLNGGSSASGGGSGGGGGSGASAMPSMNSMIAWNNQDSAQAWILIGVALVVISLLVIAILVVTRYVAETAVIRMVDLYEETEEQVSVREGFRYGWSRPAWRMFLIDLLFGFGTFIGIVLMMLVAGAPLLLWLTENDTIGSLGTAATIGLAIVFVFLVIAWLIVLSVVSQFFRRATVLEDLGVIDSIRRGWEVARRRPGDSVVMALILFGIGLGWVILMIPAYILLGIAGFVLGGIPGFTAGFLTSLVAGGALPWIVGGLVGIPIFILVFIIPALFLNGLLKIYMSSSWTLTYREMVALEGGEDRAAILPGEPLPPAPAVPAEAPEPPAAAIHPEAPEPSGESSPPEEDLPEGKPGE